MGHPVKRCESGARGGRGFLNDMSGQHKLPADVKAGGECPWSGCACRRAARCAMTAAEACVHLIRRRVAGCAECRASNGACDWTFLCFLDARDAERKRGRT